MCRETPSNTVLIMAEFCAPAAISAELSASLTIINWFTGSKAIRSTSASVRASSSAAGADSTASPHSAASAPLMQSPVSSSRFARWSPSRCAHMPAAGTPQTRVGG